MQESNNSFAAMAIDREAVLNHYEHSMYDQLIREYTDGGDFHNFGYWREGTENIKQAQENLMELLLGALPEKRGRVLDVACGKGATTRHLLKYFPAEQITGIELGAKPLETARQNAPGCTFLQMDATELDFPDGSFDVIICIEAAFHFDTRKKFIERARRVLRKGGHLLMTDVLMTREAEERRVGRTRANFLSGPQEYRNLLDSLGYVHSEVRDTTEECWKSYFWDAVRFAHQKFLHNEIDAKQLRGLLSPLYDRAPDLEYYLLVVARA